ncbi:hypothetical protein POX_e06859 [Penicillium oxalicum]|uniref:hypothetical protein n=1 Tax=Penicillium oxalicum TaxID=69781 RepID=UPI0020B63D66|nr:hypothetical protein POX_e06859 [Penicillium oxalicum]KAI2788837.1 hypothetical protein POX_e06859 [Penicillium oxalicum]
MSVRAAQFRDGESYESGSHQARPKECVVRVTTHYPPRGVLQVGTVYIWMDVVAHGHPCPSYHHVSPSRQSRHLVWELPGRTGRICKRVRPVSSVLASAKKSSDPISRQTLTLTLTRTDAGGGAPLKPAFPFTRLLVHRTSRMETAEMGEERTHRSQPEARDAEEWL